MIPLSWKKRLPCPIPWDKTLSVTLTFSVTILENKRSYLKINIQTVFSKTHVQDFSLYTSAFTPDSDRMSSSIMRSTLLLQHSCNSHEQTKQTTHTKQYSCVRIGMGICSPQQYCKKGVNLPTKAHKSQASKCLIHFFIRSLQFTQMIQQIKHSIEGNRKI